MRFTARHLFFLEIRQQIIYEQITKCSEVVGVLCKTTVRKIPMKILHLEIQRTDGS